jgi:hypothetical protein
MSLRNIRYNIQEYADKHGHNPKQLSDLIPKEKDEETCIYFDFRTANLHDEELQENPALLNRNVHYLHLPADAPGELLWVWPKPALYHGDQSPVLLKNGDVEILWPEEVVEKIGRTYEWLLEHRGKAETMPADSLVPKNP